MTTSIQLKSGFYMPLMGFGTSGLKDYDSILIALDAALECGYRLFDTAQFYENEAHIGRALEILMPKFELERKDIFITTKLNFSNMTKEKIHSSIDQSLSNLKTDYIDLFLVHYPRPDWLENQDPKVKDFRREIWLEIEKWHAEGKLRSIGVSNYELRHLDEMANYATIQPSVLQVEFHPHYCRRDYFDNVRQRGIFFQAFTSMGRNSPTLFSEPLLIELAEKYEVPVSNILLAWPLALGIGIIPKSATPERIKENFKARNVKLSEGDVEKIWGLHKHVTYTKCKPWEVL